MWITVITMGFECDESWGAGAGMVTIIVRMQWCLEEQVL